MADERVVWGPPGTGKTTAGIHLAKGWFSQMAPEEIAYLGFTKAATREALSRIMDEQVSDKLMKEKAPYFRTIHSLAYMGLRAANPDVRVLTTSDMKRFSREAGLEGRFSVHEWEDVAEVFQSLRNKGRTVYDDALTAYALSRIDATCPDDVERARKKPSRLAQRVISTELEDRVYQMVVQRYEKFKYRDGLVDFTDMLEFALCSMAPIPGIRKVVLDECQDLSPVHHAIVDRLLADTAEEIWWLGDDDQCQPKGTRVWLDREGFNVKDISELRRGDPVLSYDRRGASLTRKVVLKTASRRYSGPIYHVTAGPYTTLTTPNHRFVIRWTGTARKGKACVTYLMERGGRWRVGWCQLFNVERALHLNIRMNNERADRVWILKVHRNRTDASVYESVLAGRFGLPTAPFEPVNGATHLTRKAIDDIFEGVGDRSAQAAECLRAHGRLMGYPFIDKSKDRARHRTTLMETQACNLIETLMSLPVMVEGFLRWKPLSYQVKKVQGLSVYSLKVDKNETYVADGIVTHNSIYTFCGAKADLFLDRAARAKSQIQLRQTHRFGQDLVDFSNVIIRRVGRRMEKEVFGLPGSECIIGSRGEFRPTTGNMLVLHRHVQGCQTLAKMFMEAGLPFSNERGKDPLSATNRIKGWTALNDLAQGKKTRWGLMKILLEDVVPSFISDDDGKRVRLLVHGAKVRLKEQKSDYVDLDDLLRMKIVTPDGFNRIRAREYGVMKHQEDLEYYDRVVRNGHDLDPANSAVISTIHGSKGRQAPHVVLLSETGRKCWEDRDSEHRLAYVGATRAQAQLEICHDQLVEWAIAPYPYPGEKELTSERR